MADLTQDEINKSTAAARLAKLNLEIRNLENQSKRVDKSKKFIPVITVLVSLVTALVAVVGLSFNMWQTRKAQSHNDDLMRHEQEKERNNKIRNQIRFDNEQLLDFGNNDKISPARVVFLLGDLKSLIEQLPESETERQNTADNLSSIVWELPFNQEREIEFDVQALLHWPRFREIWKNDPVVHHGLLYKKYYLPMERIYSQDPKCVKDLVYDDVKMVYISKSGNKQCQDSFFPILLHGYEKHLDVIKESNRSDVMEKEIEEFRTLTGNSPMAQRLSGLYFKPKNVH